MIMKKCAFPTCRERIPARTKGTYCEQHKRNGQKQHYRGDEKYRRFYNSQNWRRLRQVVAIKSHGLCAECLENGLVKEGDIVHHEIPIRTPEGWEKRLEMDGLIFLCNACHNAKHPEKGGARY